MYWYMYRTCIGRDPTYSTSKKLSEITFSESHILPSSPDLRPVCITKQARTGYPAGTTSTACCRP